MTDKTEEQIAKDKEAVARMAGAKASMEAALRRIQSLETSLKTVQEECRAVGKAFGDNAHFKVWHNNGYVVRSALDIFNDINNRINAVL